MYISPESCEDNFHVHHKHDVNGEEVCTTANNCHECNTHTDNCGCNAPDVRYLKLDNQVVNEKVRIEKLQPLHLNVLQNVVSILLISAENATDAVFTCIDPPPKTPTSLDFLIQIHQLKIHCFA